MRTFSHNYESDITREQFELIRPELEGARRKTKPREIDMHSVFCAILDVDGAYRYGAYRDVAVDTGRGTQERIVSVGPIRRINRGSTGNGYGERAAGTNRCINARSLHLHVARGCARYGTSYYYFRGTAVQESKPGYVNKQAVVVVMLAGAATGYQKPGRCCRQG